MRSTSVIGSSSASFLFLFLVAFLVDPVEQLAWRLERTAETKERSLSATGDISIGDQAVRAELLHLNLSISILCAVLANSVENRYNVLEKKFQCFDAFFLISRQETTERHIRCIRYEVYDQMNMKLANIEYGVKFLSTQFYFRLFRNCVQYTRIQLR